MRVQSLVVALAILLAAQGWDVGCQILPEPERDLPSAYIPGRELTVTVSASGDFLRADVYETIPVGWSLEESDPAVSDSDPVTGTLHWRLDYPDGWWGIAWHIKITYVVKPPAGESGDVVFDGHCVFGVPESREQGDDIWAPPDPPWELVELDVPTTGDTVLLEGKATVRRVPADYPTIQAAVDASAFGDTVLVSGSGSPYVEDVLLKDGVDLIGVPDLSPPELVGFGSAICTARYTTIRGLRISAGHAGIFVPQDGVRISDCVITGTTVAAIDFTLARTGSVTNCTIVGNACGVYAPWDSRGVVVTNCIFRNNTAPAYQVAFRDVQGAHVIFSCLEDEIYMGSGENNIYADPLFINPADGDYRLSAGSPCIDAGDNLARLPGEKDIAGNDRILFGGRSQTVDMGAYEFWLAEVRLEQHSPVQPAVVWASSPGRAYTVLYSTDLLSWQVAAENVASGGATTAWFDPIGWPPPVPVRFYRITQNE